MGNETRDCPNCGNDSFRESATKVGTKTRLTCRDCGAADRLLTHMASEHGIPLSIACQIPAPALAKLCRDDQALDLEDWRR